MFEESRDSRREALKKVGKTAAFAIPTMVSFHISSLAVPPSNAGGNHYGNDTPDQNPVDVNNPHNGT